LINLASPSMRVHSRQSYPSESTFIRRTTITARFGSWWAFTGSRLSHSGMPDNGLICATLFFLQIHIAR
jgi:hypothetical protein